MSQPLLIIRLPTYSPGNKLPDENLKSLGYSSFARHYSRNRCLLSLPRPTKMFQFRRLPLPTLFYSDKSDMTLLMPGFPIRKSSVQSWWAAPRGLSQPTTSFIGKLRQGIRCVRLYNFLRNTMIEITVCSCL